MDPNRITTLRTGTKEEDRMSEAVEYIRNMDHGVIVAVGSGKQGKSASLHSLINECWPNRPVYILDPTDLDVNIFPGYRKVSTPGKVPVGCIVIIEDVNRVFPSRGSGKDSTLQKWLGTISHKSIVVCITTQSMAATDMEFLRSQDTVVMHKYMHSEDLSFERPEFKTNQAVANSWIDRMAEERPDVERRTWCFFPRFNEMVGIKLVYWWSRKHSHMLRYVNVCP